MPEADVLRAVEWDAWNWGRIAEMWLRESRLNLAGVRCLEVGGRGGALAGWLAGMGAAVLSIDIAGGLDEPLAFPAPGKAIAVHGDVFFLPEDFECDLIVFKSVLGAIGGREGIAAQAHAVSIMYKHLGEGGELWFAENLAASPLHRLARRCFVPWQASWRYVAISEFREFLHPFSTFYIEACGFLGSFGLNESQRRLLGYLDSRGVEKLVPQEWRYVLGGVAYA